MRFVKFVVFHYTVLAASFPKERDGESRTSRTSRKSPRGSFTLESSL
jgi:hypothetical protein